MKVTPPTAFSGNFRAIRPDMTTAATQLIAALAARPPPIVRVFSAFAFNFHPESICTHAHNPAVMSAPQAVNPQYLGSSRSNPRENENPLVTFWKTQVVAPEYRADNITSVARFRSL